MNMEKLKQWGPMSILIALSATGTGNAADVQIGNFYYSAPNGIAFIWADEAAFVIDPLLGENRRTAILFEDQSEGFAQAHLANDYNAGICAPDDSYHRMVLELSNNHLIEYEWARVGDAAVGRMIADHADAITFDLSKNWPGFTSHYSRIDEGIQGKAQNTGEEVVWQMMTNCQISSFDGQSVTYNIDDYTRPMRFVAGFGELPDMDTVDQLIDMAAAAYEAHRPKAIAPSGDVIGAMTNNLNNTRLYCSDEHITFIPVSRSFGVKNANQGPIFLWDSFFNGLMATYGNPEMAKATFRAVLSGALPNGMIGNVRHWSMGDSKGNSQPPVGSMCIWRSHLLRPDLDFLREAYPVLKAWNAWWMKYRNPKKNGLLAWGADNGSLQIAMYETGWDDTPHFQGAKMVGKTMNVYAVDLCALWAMDAHYLSLIAMAIGDKEAAAQHQRDADEMNKRINEHLWNEELGIYCSRFFDNEDGSRGAFLTKLAPLNFYPLISGAADEEQARRALQIMSDPKQFWGEWIIPTLSREEPEFHRQRYWSGNIWGPANYLTWLGVKRYATEGFKAEYAQKSVHLFMNNWLGSGYCGENYFTLNGRVCSNPNYTWGALLCLIGIESVIDIADDGTIKRGTGYNEPVRFENIVLGGKEYNVSVDYQKPTIRMEEQ
jgi:hypothetical protein